MERERLLAAFEHGDVDTLIQVGVLIEGWSSERCKLLIDLSPTLSRVRATQKYFRVMTRWHSAHAHIHIVLPQDLPALPILPNELFGHSAAEYECGALLGPKSSPHLPTETAAIDFSHVHSARVRKRVVFRGRLAPPRLDATDVSALRDVLRSAPELRGADAPSVHGFRGLRFEHPLFTGTGDSLLRWLRIAPTRHAYARWLCRVLPELVANAWLDASASGSTLRSLDAEARALRAFLRAPLGSSELEVGHSAWRGFLGRPVAPPRSPEDIVAARQERTVLERALAEVSSRRGRVVAERFGMSGLRPRRAREQAADRGLSHARIHGLLRTGLRELSMCVRSDASGLTVYRRIGAPAGKPGPMRAPEPARMQLGRWTALSTPWSLLHAQAAIDRLLAQLEMPPVDWPHPEQYVFVEDDGVPCVEQHSRQGPIELQIWSVCCHVATADGGEEARVECGLSLDGLPGRTALELRGRGALLDETRVLDGVPSTLDVSQGSPLAAAARVQRAWATVLGARVRPPRGSRGARG